MDCEECRYFEVCDGWDCCVWLINEDGDEDDELED